MPAEVNETPRGWPLGLENMNMRLQVIETLQAAPVAMEQNSHYVRSISSSSFSSSGLDTESTRSFFPVHSITLGRLIGIKPGDRGLHFPSANHPAEHDHVVRASSRGSNRNGMEVSHGICIPSLLNILVKINPSKSSSRQ